MPTRRTPIFILLTGVFLCGASLGDDRGAVVAEPEWPILFTAVKAGEVEAVKRLIASGEGIDVKAPGPWGESLLHAAAAAGVTHPKASLGIAKVLIEAGLDVNVAMRSGFTPLHEAVRSGSVELTELLIAKGARVNSRVTVRNCLDPDCDFNGFTPTDVAGASKNGKLLALLRKHGGKTGRELDDARRNRKKGDEVAGFPD